MKKFEYKILINYEFYADDDVNIDEEYTDNYLHSLEAELDNDIVDQVVDIVNENYSSIKDILNTDDFTMVWDYEDSYVEDSMIVFIFEYDNDQITKGRNQLKQLKELLSSIIFKNVRKSYIDSDDGRLRIEAHISEIPKLF